MSIYIYIYISQFGNVGRCGPPTAADFLCLQGDTRKYLRASSLGTIFWPSMRAAGQALQTWKGVAQVMQSKELFKVLNMCELILKGHV